MKRSNFLKSLVALPTLGGLANLATWETSDDSIGSCYLTYEGTKISGTDKIIKQDNLHLESDFIWLDITYKQLDCGMVDGYVLDIGIGKQKSNLQPILTNGSDLSFRCEYDNRLL